jgi:predicted dehydrogenase
MKKNICVIGAGGHSKFHCAALQELKTEQPELFELSAICDLNNERAMQYQKKYGFHNAYTDIQTMLESEQIDGIIAITPVPVTEKIVSELLPLSIPLLIEKPAGANSTETRRLLDLNDKYQTPHMISMNRRFTPALNQAVSWLKENRDPKLPLYMTSRILRNKRLENEFVTSTSIHLLDIILYLLGNEYKITGNKVMSPSGNCRHFYSNIAFADGSFNQCIIAPDAGTLEETHEIHCVQSCLKIDMMNNTLSIKQNNETVYDRDFSINRTYEYNSGHYNEALAFIDLLNDKRSMACPDLQNALDVMLLAEQLSQ